jgi:DNA-binding FrmR family transcriptional regulator
LGIPAITCLTCEPQPDHVALPQRRHEILLHILLSSNFLLWFSGRLLRLAPDQRSGVVKDSAVERKHGGKSCFCHAIGGDRRAPAAATVDRVSRVFIELGDLGIERGAFDINVDGSGNMALVKLSGGANIENDNAALLNSGGKLSAALLHHAFSTAGAAYEGEGGDGENCCSLHRQQHTPWGMLFSMPAKKSDPMLPAISDETAIREVSNRLKRAQGQLGGIVGMLEDGRSCQEIVTQLAAVNKAIDRAAFSLIATGLKECLTEQKKDVDAVSEQLQKLFLTMA